MKRSGTRQVPSPEWLAHRYDPDQDAVHLVKADRALRRRAPFLTDEHLPGATAPVVARRADIGGDAQAPVNFIFHSAYCCSTLLANAYDRDGKAFSLKEPVLLNDLIGWGQRGGPAAAIKDVLRDGLNLFARPFIAGEVCVIKPSNLINPLAGEMIRLRTEAGALLLHAPLKIYLGSIASKGLWGRLWARDLFAKLAANGLIQFAFEQEDYFGQTDLQIAGLGWLAQHMLFARIAGRWPERVRTIDSETMLARPNDALAALDTLFKVPDNDASRAAVVTQVFSRHAKFGAAFDASSRTADQESAAAVHGEEIDKVFEWVVAVAASASIDMTLPQPLLT